MVFYVSHFENDHGDPQSFMRAKISGTKALKKLKTDSAQRSSNKCKN